MLTEARFGPADLQRTVYPAGYAQREQEGRLVALVLRAGRFGVRPQHDPANRIGMVWISQAPLTDPRSHG